jgi:hypothetical protein
MGIFVEIFPTVKSEARNEMARELQLREKTTEVSL